MPKNDEVKRLSIGANPNRIAVEQKREEVEQKQNPVTLEDIYAQNLYIIDLLMKRA